MLQFQTLRPAEPVAISPFQKGDRVFLAKGPYKGTVGTFLKFKNNNRNWADILENNSQVRSHHVKWLHHSVWLHAIVVDGVIQRIQGSPTFADAEIEKHRKNGRSSAYLFAARSDEEFARKELDEIARPVYPAIKVTARVYPEVRIHLDEVRCQSGGGNRRSRRYGPQRQSPEGEASPSTTSSQYSKVGTATQPMRRQKL